MIRNIFSFCILVIVFSCNSDEPEKPTNFHFTAVKFPNSLGATRLVSNDHTTVIASSFYPVNDRLSISGLDEKGSVLWSKMVAITGGTNLSLNRMVPVDETSFLLIASGAWYSFVIKADFDGNVLSVSKYAHPSEALAINRCTVTKNGSRICSCAYYDAFSQKPYGLIFEESTDGNIVWAKAINQQSVVTAVLSESENSICVFSSDNIILLLDRNGLLLSSHQMQTNLVFEDIDVIDDHFYAVFYPWNGQGYTVLKIDDQANIVKGIKSANAYTYNPEISVMGSSLFVVSEIESELKVVELGTDLNVVHENTFARLVGSSDGLLSGRISASLNNFSCLIEPFADAPPFGTSGVNVLKALRSDWAPKCKIANPINFLVNSTSITTQQLDGVSMADYDLQKSVVEFSLTNQTIESSAICQ